MDAGQGLVERSIPRMPSGSPLGRPSSHTEPIGERSVHDRCVDLRARLSAVEDVLGGTLQRLRVPAPRPVGEPGRAPSPDPTVVELLEAADAILCRIEYGARELSQLVG